MRFRVRYPLPLLLIAALSASGAAVERAGAPTERPPVRECDTPRPAWIWCDDFEEDRLSHYFEYDSAGGAFARVPGVGSEGSAGMRAAFRRGTVGAGSLHLAFGRTPDPYLAPVDGGTENHREIFWRLLLRYPPGWVGGGGDKLSRATVFATPQWAQAMVAHLWSGSSGDGANRLVLDPVRGTDPSGRLQTARYNDGEHFTWLGAEASQTRIFAPPHLGAWHCVEAHVRLNDAGSANGIFELWIDGRPEAVRGGIDFLGSYSDYGLNAVFVENYWNDGAPADQERYFDNFVVSTERIGC